ncbi:unnamed protein product [Caenorhabditis auriculariae]|uniref:Uncharacterized protein n=1 Tax=Caenorhabditis auriculariae TaxID=2777116 RepID=A0A8S1HCG6_9PELO|nr:unnamed protein product [Caenorhabditis auriculariae]
MEKFEETKQWELPKKEVEDSRVKGIRGERKDGSVGGEADRCQLTTAVPRGPTCPITWISDQSKILWKRRLIGTAPTGAVPVEEAPRINRNNNGADCLEALNHADVTSQNGEFCQFATRSDGPHSSHSHYLGKHLRVKRSSDAVHSDGHSRIEFDKQSGREALRDTWGNSNRLAPVQLRPPGLNFVGVRETSDDNRSR